jgi:hypothetical protein
MEPAKVAYPIGTASCRKIAEQRRAEQDAGRQLAEHRRLADALHEFGEQPRHREAPVKLIK